MTTALATLAPHLRAGRWAVDALAVVGRFAAFTVEVARGLREVRIWWPRTLAEMWQVGVASIPIVLLVSSFAGAVTALQTGYQFQSALLPYSVVGALITASILLELGPVLTALILAGRVGARYAAELGTMRVTEQIDALESLGRSPSSHLLVPRVLAGLVMVPVLTVFADVVGIAAGWLSAKSVLPITDADFAAGAQQYYRPFDAWYSLIKAFCFALSITLVPCFVGFQAGQGAEGVGRSTTAAVVASSVLVLLLDTVLAKVLLV